MGKRNITEFNYRFASSKKAHVFVGVQLQDRDTELPALLDLLREKSYEVVDMSDNEMAKLHIRYMVGGTAPEIDDEELIRFEFPERPGALMAFLSGLGRRWNISLFHYRNHGAAYGRVLVGLQIKEAEKKELRKFLTDLGYRFWEETDNPAYRRFL